MSTLDVEEDNDEDITHWVVRYETDEHRPKLAQTITINLAKSVFFGENANVFMSISQTHGRDIGYIHAQLTNEEIDEICTILQYAKKRANE